jgi:hypothetical protein
MSNPDDDRLRLTDIRRELAQLRADLEILRRHDMLGPLVRAGYPIDDRLRRGDRTVRRNAKKAFLRRLTTLEREVDSLAERHGTDAPLN